MNVERHVVLIAPEVHWNTGNIGRTCLGAGACLHLIKPLGFSIDSREVKRAGLDYWENVRLFVWDDFSDFMRSMKPDKKDIVLLTKNGKQSFWDMPANKKLFLIFGSETKGIDKEIMLEFEASTFYIPVSKEIRCLNLSTAVGIALYESLSAFRPAHSWKQD